MFELVQRNALYSTSSSRFVDECSCFFLRLGLNDTRDIRAQRYFLVRFRDRSHGFREVIQALGHLRGVLISSRGFNAYAGHSHCSNKGRQSLLRGTILTLHLRQQCSRCGCYSRAVSCRKRYYIIVVINEHQTGRVVRLLDKRIGNLGRQRFFGKLICSGDAFAEDCWILYRRQLLAVFDSHRPRERREVIQ